MRDLLVTAIGHNQFSLIDIETDDPKAIHGKTGEIIDIDWEPIKAQRDYDRTAEAVRVKRDKQLAEVDIEILKAEDAGQDTAALRSKRQALRDVPQQEGFPDNVVWP